MQTLSRISNLLNAINSLLQLWYFRLMLCSTLLLVVSIFVYALIVHLTSSAPLASGGLSSGPCDPTCP